jgi:hypothetical protein
LRTAHGVLFQGQAAGIAAAIAIETSKAVGGIDVKQLQKELRAAGVEIPNA